MSKPKITRQRATQAERDARKGKPFFQELVLQALRYDWESELDDVLTCFFVEGHSYQRIAKARKLTLSTVRSKLTKMFINYQDYNPGSCRGDRTGQPWTNNEKEAVRYAVAYIEKYGKGPQLQNGQIRPVNPGTLSRLLMRTVAEVADTWATYAEKR